MVSLERRELLEFIDEMRNRGAVEITVGDYHVKFEAKKQVTTEVLVDKRAQQVEDEYAKELAYWNKGIEENY